MTNLNEIFKFNNSNKVKISEDFIENSDDKKELILLEDITLAPLQTLCYNTGLKFSIIDELKDYSFRLHFYQCELVFENNNYIVYDNIYEENMKIKIYIHNLLNSEYTIKKDTVLGNFYFVSKCRSFFEVYNKLKEENEYKIKYKYNDLLLKDKNDKISMVVYNENIVDGNTLLLKLKD